MKEFNVHEVLAILQKYYITDSQQMVSRWIRDGKIHGVRSENRKNGTKVTEEDLFDFIEEQRPGLPAIMDGYEKYISSIDTDLFAKETEEDDLLEDEHIDKAENTNDEMEINKMQEAISDLQEKILETEDEKLNINKKITILQDKLDMILEKHQQLIEIISTLNTELEKLKENESKVSPKHSATNVQTNYEMKPYSKEEFMKISYEVINELDFTIEKEVQNEHLHTIYEEIYDRDGNIKEEISLKSGLLKCPYTHREYKQQKRLVKSVVSNYFITNKSKIEEQ